MCIVFDGMEARKKRDWEQMSHITSEEEFGMSHAFDDIYPIGLGTGRFPSFRISDLGLCLLEL